MAGGRRSIGKSGVGKTTASGGNAVSEDFIKSKYEFDLIDFKLNSGC